eukprot:Em0011g1147a
MLVSRQAVLDKHQAALALLSTINDLGSVDPQVALVICSSFCKLAHIVRATPPHLILGPMEKFDTDVRHSFAECTGCDVPDSAWRQAQLSLRRGGFGLRSSALHSSAAYVASVCGSDMGVMAGSAAKVAECCKHDLNDPKCLELGWKCTPLAVETYGCWGAEARETLSRLATCLAIPMRCTKSQAAAIYGKLSLTLVRSCERALLSRAGPSLVITG